MWEATGQDVGGDGVGGGRDVGDDRVAGGIESYAEWRKKPRRRERRDERSIRLRWRVVVRAKDEC